MDHANHKLTEDDEDDIRFFYWDLGLSTSEVADEFGVCQQTMVDTMDRLGIERRPPGGAVPDGEIPWRNHEKLERMYTGEATGERLSQAAIAEKMGCSPATIRRQMRKAGIETRNPGWREE